LPRNAALTERWQPRGWHKQPLRRMLQLYQKSNSNSNSKWKSESRQKQKQKQKMCC